MKKRIQALIIAVTMFLSANGLTIANEENLTVGEIRFSRLYELPSDFLLSKIPIKTGDTFNNKDISDTYLSLKNLRYISDANIYTTIDNGVVNFNIEVDERANALQLAQQEAYEEELQQRTEFLIKDFDIVGLNKLNKDEFLKLISLRVNDYFVPQNAIDGAQALFDSGYFSLVEPEVIRNADNTISVIYHVEENPVVNNIILEGNTLFSDDILIEQLGLKSGDIINTKLLDPSSNGIIRYYSNEGYTLARIESIQLTPEGNIAIGLTEGIVSNVTFRKRNVRSDNMRSSKYSSSLRTKDYVFERVLEVKKGEVFRIENVEKTMRELYRTGIFTAIEPQFYGDEVDPQIRNVDFIITERPTTTINGTISYGTEVGLVGGITLSDANFLGRGQEASINVEASNQGDKTFEVSFFDPWIKGTERVQAGGSIYWRQVEDDDAAPSDISKVKRYGTRWTIGKGLNSNIYVRTAARIDNYKEYIPSGLRLDKYNLFAITPSLIYDTRNNSFNPTKGVYGSLSYEVGKLFSRESALGETGDFYQQVEVDLRGYHPTFFGDKNTMAYRAVWGRTGSETPQGLRYSIGGAESVRGYEAGDMKGFDKFFFSIENRTQINSAVQFVAFFDIGNAWRTIEPSNINGIAKYTPDRKSANKFSDLKKGYGIGLRLNTPMGPLRFDYGWPMDTIEGETEKGKGRFYFSFGQTF